MGLIVVGKTVDTKKSTCSSRSQIGQGICNYSLHRGKGHSLLDFFDDLFILLQVVSFMGTYTVLWIKSLFHAQDGAYFIFWMDGIQRSLRIWYAILKNLLISYRAINLGCFIIPWMNLCIMFLHIIPPIQTTETIINEKRSHQQMTLREGWHFSKRIMHAIIQIHV